MSERHRLPPAVVLLVAVAAISWGGPLTKFATAPAHVVSAWRLIFSVAFISIVLLARRTPVPRLARTDWLLAAGAGVMLALHFWAWIASLKFTSVASSVVLVNMQPLFVASMSGLLLREYATRTQWTGIVIATIGAVVVGIGDAHGAGEFGARALFGDALALLGAVFVSAYYLVGRRLRQQLDLWLYIGIVYGVAALVLLAIVAVDPRAHLTGYPRTDWLVFLGLAAGPMMLGHTGINYSLRFVPAFVANIAMLGEPVGATLIAWALPQIREVPSMVTLAGAVLIGIGILLAARHRRAENSAE